MGSHFAGVKPDVGLMQTNIHPTYFFLVSEHRYTGFESTSKLNCEAFLGACSLCLGLVHRRSL